MVIDPMLVYAVVGAVAGVLIPVVVPKLFKKASYPTLRGVSAVGKVAEQLVGKGSNKV